MQCYCTVMSDHDLGTISSNTELAGQETFPATDEVKAAGDQENRWDLHSTSTSATISHTQLFIAVQTHAKCTAKAKCLLSAH